MAALCASPLTGSEHGYTAQFRPDDSDEERPASVDDTANTPVPGDAIDLTAGEESKSWDIRQLKSRSPSSSLSRELARPISDSVKAWQSDRNGGSTDPTNTGLVAHQVDLAITSHVGLSTMLGRMGENHGFHANIVNRVYLGSSGLEETDKILNVMRQVAETRGQQEICRREKKWRE